MAKIHEDFFKAQDGKCFYCKGPMLLTGDWLRC